MSFPSWQMPLWGSLSQVGVGGGVVVPPEELGSSFFLLARRDQPFGTESLHYSPGDEPVAGAAFFAPFNMTIKSIAVSDSGTEYGANTTFSIKVNDGAAVPFGSEVFNYSGLSLYDINQTFSTGDKIEIIHTSTFQTGTILTFCVHVERSGAPTSGPFVSILDQNRIASFPVAANFAIRKVGFYLDAPATVEHTISLFKNGVGSVLGTVPIGGQSVIFSAVDALFIRGETFDLRSSGRTPDGGRFTIESEIIGEPLLPNESLLIMADPDISAAGPYAGGKFNAISPGSVSRVGLQANREGMTGQINVSKNGEPESPLLDYVIASGGDSEQPNYGFQSGDFLNLSHSAAGGAAIGAQLLVGLRLNAVDNIDLSYTHVPAEGLVAAGGLTDVWAGAGSNNNSAFNVKGNYFLVREPRIVTQLNARLANTGPEFKFIIAEVNPVNTTIVDIVYESGINISNTSLNTISITEDVVLMPGKLYLIGTWQPDGATHWTKTISSGFSLKPTDPLWPIGYGYFNASPPAVGSVSGKVASNVQHDIRVYSEAAAARESFTYWCILCQGSGDANFQGFAELKTRIEIGASPITINRILGNSAYDVPVSLRNVLDGNVATRWRFNNSDYVEADRRLVWSYNEPKPLVEISLTAHSGAGAAETITSFKVQGSPDGINWVDVATVTGEPAWTAGEERNFTVGGLSIKPDENPHRYWAVFVLESADGNTKSIEQLEFRETPMGPDVTTEAFAIAGTLSSGVPTNAFNNGPLGQTPIAFSRTAQAPLDRWIGQDFGAGNEKRIVEITVRGWQNFASRAPRNGCLAFSDDAVNWTLAYPFGFFGIQENSSRRVYQNPNYVETYTAGGGGITLPAGVPMPVLWYSPDHVVLGDDGRVDYLLNRGSGGSRGNAFASSLIAKLAVAPDAGWGGRNVFDTRNPPARNGYETVQEFTGLRSMATMTNFSDGAATFQSGGAAITASAIEGSGTVFSVYGASASAALNSGNTKVYKDGVALASPTSPLLPLAKNGLGATLSAGGRVGCIFRHSFLATRVWFGLTGEIMLWDVTLTDAQFADVHAAMAAYYA